MIPPTCRAGNHKPNNPRLWVLQEDIVSLKRAPAASAAAASNWLRAAQPAPLTPAVAAPGSVCSPCGQCCSGGRCGLGSAAAQAETLPEGLHAQLALPAPACEHTAPVHGPGAAKC